MKAIGLTPWILLAVSFGLPGRLEAREPARPRPITLGQCLREAIQHNLGLQIERLNPRIAADNLAASKGYYDPLLATDSRWESASDSGGFDPVDFSRDAVYSADSQTVRAGVTGFVPSGMSYALSGSYAHSSGERNLLNFESYGLLAGVVAQQPLLKNLWIDAPRLTIRLNRKALQISELGVQFALLDLMNRVQWAYYELLFAREHLSVQQQLQESRRRLIAGMERQVGQGALAESDTLPARVDLAAGNAALVTSSNAVVLAEIALRHLMSDDLREDQRTLLPLERLETVPSVLNLQARWSQGLMNRPDLSQLRVEVQRSELNVRFRRNQLFPSLNLLGGYNRRGASTAQLPPPLTPHASAGDAFEQLADGSVPSHTVGILFSVPFSRATERAAYRASRALKDQAELWVLQKEQQVLREIADAVNTAQAASDRAVAARSEVDLGAAALAAEERKLAGGRSSVFFVLQLQNQYLSAQSIELRAQADHMQAMSQLGFADGSLLERVNWVGDSVPDLGAPSASPREDTAGRHSPLGRSFPEHRRRLRPVERRGPKRGLPGRRRSRLPRNQNSRIHWNR